jgi:eukaryotic-like serine/threonine-protein kinase
MMPAELVPGSFIGPWKVLERLDWGNYGTVFLAQRAGHPESPPVALKMARRPLEPRFEREGLLLQRTPHPGIPRYEDSGVWTSPGGYRFPYLVMELVDGFTLYDWFRQQPRSSRQVLAVLEQLASALAAAHANGAVHRDVKGDNIRVTAQGRVVLLDWGSGWFAGARPLTDTPAPPGTTAYRPPEQRNFIWRFRMDLEARWHAQPSDDLYALGVTLYRLVTGVYLPPLTDGGAPVERKVLRPSAMATLCPDLETLILRLIDDDRRVRGTAEQLAREVSALMKRVGPEADKPILPTSSAMPTDEGFSPSDERHDEEVLSDTDGTQSTSDAPAVREDRCPRGEYTLPAWLFPVSAAMVGGLLVFLGWEMHRAASQQHSASSPWMGTPEEVAQFAPDAGVGDEAVSTVQDAPSHTSTWVLSLGRPMPTKPLPGQKRPPCDRGEKEINGGCWFREADERPPCGDKLFDYEGRCYFYAPQGARVPTSDPP